MRGTRRGREAECRPEAAGLGGRRGLGAAQAGVEGVGGVGVRELAGRAEPGQDVGGAAVRQRRAGEREHAGAEAGPRQRHAGVGGDRDAVVGEALGEHGGGALAATDEHGDVLRRHALAHELEHLGRDQLGLGALPARLQDPHGAVRREPLARGLEQLPLEVVQGRAGAVRVVL